MADITETQLKDARKACDAAEETGRVTLLRTEVLIVANRLLSWFPAWMRPGKNAFAERYIHWVGHVETHVNIKNKLVVAPADWANQRIEVISEDLNIVDDKIAKILQFQALMLAAVSIGLGSLRSHDQLSFDFIPSWFASYFKTTVYMGFAFWFFSTLLCLWGVRRLAWGDLWKSGDNLVEAEKKHLDVLVCEVIKRTAKFRLAVIFTVFNVLFLAFFLVMLLYHWQLKPDHTDSPPVAAYTGPIGDVGPFDKIVACGNEVSLQRQVGNAADEIQKKSVKTVLIVGSADALRIGDSSASLYGNETGMSLARARCVAGWLNQELALRGLHVETMIGVRDAEGRTSKDRKDGNPADRHVTISSIPENAHP